MDQPKATGAQAPGFYRFKLGDLTAVALHDGTLSFDRPPGFVLNAADGEVGEAFARAGMPRDKVTLTFTALAIETGSGVVLIDTGMGESGPPGTGMLAANLVAAGLRPEDVTTVVISHFHSDHIAGLLRKDGSPAFERAQVMVPGAEWDYWMDDAAAAAAPEGMKGNFDLVRRVFGPALGTVGRYAWGDTLLPGMTSVQANGHTPGMSAIQVTSAGKSMMFVADITNTPLLFARNPEWQLMFDMDPAVAVQTRRKLLDQAAADNLQLFFFHAPFPGLGYVIKSGEGYEYLPALWTA